MKKLVYSPDYRDKIIQLKNDLDQKYGQTVRKKVLSEINHHMMIAVMINKKTTPF